MSVLLFQGNRSPSITDRIEAGGVLVDLTGASVRFRMRAEWSAALKVDAEATPLTPVDEDDPNVRYDPAAADVDTPGEFVGWWRVTFADGRVQESDGFRVLILAHAPLDRALCSLVDVKRWGEVDPAEDDLVVRLIAAVSETIQDVAEREVRPIGQNPQTRVFDVRRDPLVPGTSFRELPIGDLASFTAVTVDGTAAAPANVTGLPRTRKGWQPITRLRFGPSVSLPVGAEVAVTGNFGFPAVPERLRQAAIEQVSTLMNRDISKFSDTFVDAAGRVVIPPGELKRSVLDTALAFRKTRRTGSARIAPPDVYDGAGRLLTP